MTKVSLETLYRWRELPPAQVLPLLYQALRDSQSNPPFMIAQCQLELASCLQNLGQYGKAAEHAKFAHLIFEELNDQSGVCDCLNTLGAVHSVLGEFHIAFQHFSQALAIAQRSAWVAKEVKALLGQARVYSNIGYSAKAVELTLLALELQEVLGDQNAIMRGKINLGRYLVEENDLTRALQILQEVIPEARRLAEPVLLKNSLINLGFANMNLALEQLNTEAWEVAQTAMFEAWQLSQASNDAQGQVVCLVNMSEIASRRQQFKLAIDYLQQAQMVNQKVKDSAQAIRILKALGEANASLGECKLGLELIEDALQQARQSGSLLLESQVLEALSNALEQVGEVGRALDYLKQLRTLERQLRSENARFQAQGLMIEYETLQLHRQAEQERQQRNQLEIENAKLAQLSLEDALTRAYNRRYLEAFLEYQLSATQQNSWLCLAMLDIDFFKQINDTLSHAVGDLVLKEVVNVVKASIRNADVLARYGGEEFVVVMPDTNLKTGLAVCEQIRFDVEQHDWENIHPTLHVTLSLGLVARQNEQDAQNLLAAADSAMYAAKKAGRNQVKLGTFSDTTASN